MSDLMLHGVLNMPLPDDPAEMDTVTWLQFRDRAHQASEELQRRTDWLMFMEGAAGATADCFREWATAAIEGKPAPKFRPCTKQKQNVKLENPS